MYPRAFSWRGSVRSRCGFPRRGKCPPSKDGRRPVAGSADRPAFPCPRPALPAAQASKGSRNLSGRSHIGRRSPQPRHAIFLALWSHSSAYIARKWPRLVTEITIDALEAQNAARLMRTFRPHGPLRRHGPLPPPRAIAARRQVTQYIEVVKQTSRSATNAGTKTKTGHRNLSGSAVLRDPAPQAAARTLHPGGGAHRVVVMKDRQFWFGSNHLPGIRWNRVTATPSRTQPASHTPPTIAAGYEPPRSSFRGKVRYEPKPERSSPAVVQRGPCCLRWTLKSSPATSTARFIPAATPQVRAHEPRHRRTFATRHQRRGARADSADVPQPSPTRCWRST